MRKHFVHSDLKGLELYEVDPQLCKRYPNMLEKWRERYWMVDVQEVVRDCHLWELENPQKRKRDRIAFIGNWLRRVKKEWERKHEAEVAERKRAEAIERRNRKDEPKDFVSPETRDEYIEKLRKRIGRIGEGPTEEEA